MEVKVCGEQKRLRWKYLPYCENMSVHLPGKHKALSSSPSTTKTKTKDSSIIHILPNTHVCNPNYSGGRDQEDSSSKPARANSSRDPISKNLFTKKGWWSGSRCSPEFKP
jgi:hypothetical protein